MKIHPCVWPPDQFEGLCQISEIKLVKWKKIKTALCDLTKKLLRSNFHSSGFAKTNFSVKSSWDVH